MRSTVNDVQTVRLFIAIDLPPDILKEIDRLVTDLKKKELFTGRYVLLEKIHLTLHFLGETRNDVMPKLDNLLSAIAVNKFTATLRTLDYIRRGPDIKIIYLSVIAPELHILAKKIQHALVDFREPEQRDFLPHITLARVKQVNDKDALVKYINEVSAVPLTFDISEFVLKESVFSPDGHIHTVLSRYNLR